MHAGTADTAQTDRPYGDVPFLGRQVGLPLLGLAVKRRQWRADSARLPCRQSFKVCFSTSAGQWARFFSA